MFKSLVTERANKKFKLWGSCFHRIGTSWNLIHHLVVAQRTFDITMVTQQRN